MVLNPFYSPQYVRFEQLAPAYDSTATYAVGDYVTYEYNLYRCTTAVTTAGAFDPSKWNMVDVTGQLTNDTIASSTTAVNPSVTNSADGLIQDIKVYGRSKVSKNLYDKNATDTSQGYENNSFLRSDGTDPANGDYVISEYIAVNGGETYVLSNPASGANQPSLCFYNAAKQYISGVNYAGETNIIFTTPTTASLIRFSVLIANIGITQLEKGDTPTPYESYFSGIRSIGDSGSLSVQTCGKNWLDIGNSFDDWWRLTNDGKRFISPYNTSISPWATGNVNPETGTIVVSTYDHTGYGWAGREVKLRKNTTYKLNTNTSAGYWGITGFSSIGNNVDGEAISISNSQFNTGNYEHIFFVFYPYQFNFVGIGIYLSDETDPTFEPYKAPTTATVTTGIPLYAVGDVKDELDEKKGVVIKRCEKVVLPATGWVKNGDNGTTSKAFYNNSALSKATKAYAGNVVADLICDSLTAKSIDAIYSGTVGVGMYQNRVDVRIEGITTALELETYLTTNSISIVYELAEPYEIPLSASEITQLRGLKTFNPTTNVTVTNDPTVDIGYLLNTDNGQAIADMQNELNEQIDDVQEQIDDKVLTTTTTLLAASWTGASAPYSQTVNVTGIRSTDIPIIDVSVSNTVATGLDEIAAFSNITKATTDTGTITFMCYEEAPTVDLILNIKVVR